MVSFAEKIRDGVGFGAVGTDMYTESTASFVRRDELKMLPLLGIVVKDRECVVLGWGAVVPPIPIPMEMDPVPVALASHDSTTSGV